MALTKAQRTAMDLLEHNRKEIDVDRKYSHPKAKTFIDQSIGGHTMSLSVTNSTKRDTVICIGSAHNSQFRSSE
ncbi:MAG: hypothetical protein MK066_13565, partial [Crocinitomicaceae bacterium]|nr:hypothetical protein [Crocinitomicaceae bacterium]